MELLQASFRRVRHWVLFVGPARVAAGAAALAVAGLLAVFMFAPSAPPPELVLPLSTSVGVTTAVTPPTVPPSVVRVHVAGAVRRPGVYGLRPSARVVDAVAAAGGASPDADLDAINLAQTVLDTEQIYVPHRARAQRRSPSPRLAPKRRTAASPSTSPTAVPTSPGTTTAGRVNINTATAAQLDSLPGVGPATAKAIIAHRQSKGPFTKVEDLLNVPGIGPSKLDAMRGMIET